MPLTSELKAELVKQAHKSGYIFGQGKDGRPPQQAAISVAFGRLMRDIGLEGVTQSRPAAHRRLGDGRGGNLLARRAGYRRLVNAADARALRAAEMSRAVRVLTAYTTGTKTGRATKNRNGDPEGTDAASAVKSEVRKWRPQRASRQVAR